MCDYDTSATKQVDTDLGFLNGLSIFYQVIYR